MNEKIAHQIEKMKKPISLEQEDTKIQQAEMVT